MSYVCLNHLGEYAVSLTFHLFWRLALALFFLCVSGLDDIINPVRPDGYCYVGDLSLSSGLPFGHCQKNAHETINTPWQLLCWISELQSGVDTYSSAVGAVNFEIVCSGCSY